MRLICNMHETFTNLGGGIFMVGELWFHWKGYEMALGEETQSVRLDWSWLMIDFSDSHK